jgi:hypothetical protein
MSTPLLAASPEFISVMVLNSSLGTGNPLENTSQVSPDPQIVKWGIIKYTI